MYFLTHFQSLRWLVVPFFGPHAAMVEYLVRAYARNSMKVLDLGARRSPYTRGVRGILVGLDLPAAKGDALGFTQQSLTHFDQAQRFSVFGQGEYLPFQNNTFDTVLLIEVIEHILDDEKAVKEIARVLKSGGLLILTTPNGDTFPRPSKHHLRHYTHKALRELVGVHFIIERFWGVFPQGRLWQESVASVRRMLDRKNISGLIHHGLALALYWPQTLTYFFAKKSKGTTTWCLVARKPL